MSAAVCPDCGAAFDASGETTVHAYLGASPECWAAVNLLWAKEYEEPAYFRAHRLTVDAYALQRPGDLSDGRALRSVWVHLFGLHHAFVGGVAHGRIPPLMQKAVVRLKRAAPPIDRPSRLGAVTVLDVLGARDAADHYARADNWARAVHAAWSHAHDVVKDLVDQLGPSA